MLKITTLVILLIPGLLRASEVTFLPYEKVLVKITHVFVVKVANVETKENYKYFQNGIKRHTSTEVTVHGSIQESLKGDAKKKEIVTQYTFYEPIHYSDEGKIEISYSPILSASGHELDVKKGSSYIFSYSKFTEKSTAQSYMRMDLMKEKEEISKQLEELKI